MENNKIKDYLSENLSGLYISSERHREWMDEIVGGRKMKKKLSVGLILAIVMVFALAGIAYAYFSWQQVAQNAAKLESEAGYFENWSLAEKTKLLTELVACGAIADGDNVCDALAEGQVESAASNKITKVLEDWIGVPEDAISVISILERILGKFDTWSVEDKAWYSDILIETGRIGYDEAIHLLPSDQDILQKDALMIACDGIMKTYGLTENEMDLDAVDYDFYAMPSSREDHKWLLSFRPQIHHAKSIDIVYCLRKRNDCIL